MRDDEFVRHMKSTIVRSSNPSRLLPLTRAGVRALSALAPSVAARLAERWFLTPPRQRRPPAEIALIASARARPVAITGGSDRVQTWRWGAGPTVLLVHGWGGRGAQLGALVAPLVASGFSAVAYDAPGHGASPRRLVTIPEMVAALQAVAAAHGPVSGLVAHSAGSVVATRALSEGLDADAAVFLAPAADLVDPAARFAQVLGFPRRVGEEMRRRIERRVGMPWSAFSIAALAPALRAPALVVHDRGDGEISWQHGRIVARAWAGAKLLTTDGLGHRRLLRDPEVVAAAVAFLAAHVAEHRPERTRPGRAAAERLPIMAG